MAPPRSTSRGCSGSWKGISSICAYRCKADAVAVIDESIAWRLFTKRLDRATARARFPAIRIDGDVELGERMLEMVSIKA